MMYHKKEFPVAVHEESLDNYLSNGWFRIRESIFTTSHLINHEQNDLNRVWWLRYNLGEVETRKSHSTILKKNNSFTYRISEFIDINESHTDLFKRYTKSISFETYDEIREAIYGEGNHNPFKTKIIEVSDDQKLIAVGIFDIGKEASQSILHFYDPDYSKYSLGKYLLLITVKYLKEKNFTYYYPGYIVCNRPCFDYKLCLGENIAQYYDPSNAHWLAYDESIMKDREYTEDDVIDFFLLTFSFKREKPRMFYEVNRLDCIKGSLLDNYLENGWFRMQSTIYRNSHILDAESTSIYKVWRLKYIISEIKAHSSHKRIWKLNRNFEVVFSNNLSITNEDKDLYSRYFSTLDFEGYRNILEAISDDGRFEVYDTNCVRIYDENKLIAMGLFDKGKVSIASILNFYDPNYSKYSLGKYIILLIIEKMKEWGMFCYFPGYIVAGKPKFDYKLFLGEESAKYMNREQSWIRFDRSILKPERSTFKKFVDFVQLVSNAEDKTLSDEIN